MSAENPDSVEIVYALPEKQALVSVPFAPGMTARDAVNESGLLALYPEIEDQPLVLGVWGIEVGRDHPLKAGDRVEISRPLLTDPREMRRERLADGRVMGGAAPSRVRNPGSDRD